MAERQFKYRWDRTWAEVPEDYLAFDGEMKIGRVHRMNSISAGGWYWAMNAAIEWSGSVAGTAETRDEACREVERQYDAMVARIAAVEGNGLETRPAGERRGASWLMTTRASNA
jgi:hypothetical protein